MSEQKKNLTKKDKTSIKKTMNYLLRSYSHSIEENLLKSHVDYSEYSPKWSKEGLTQEIKEFRYIVQQFHQRLADSREIFVCSINEWAKKYYEL